jgi:hypothetical protein
VRLRAKIGLVVIVLGSVFLWGRCSRPATPQPPKLPAALLANDAEQIRVDPSTHRITITTPAGARTLTLPDRSTTIDVRKGGQVNVTSPQLGLEARPFVGLGYGQGVRVYLGADLLYWKVLDLGLGVALPSMTDKSGWNFNDVRGFVGVSYNIWSNSRIGVGIDQQKAVHVVLSVRI